MIRSIITRTVLAASFCVLASAQVAHAAAHSSLRSLQLQDVNDSRTQAGRIAKAAADKDCPLAADKSSRFHVASAKTEVTAQGSRANAHDVVR